MKVALRVTSKHDGVQISEQTVRMEPGERLTIPIEIRAASVLVNVDLRIDVLMIEAAT